jgi:DNA-binding MarR family transcriptional regulator
VSKAVPSAIPPASEVRDRCLCLHAQRVARALARRFDEALRPHGLTSGQFSLLTALSGPQPPTVSEAADLLAMDRSTVTAALKPLARSGLVLVDSDPADGRVKRPRLTEAGCAVLARAGAAWRIAHDTLDRELGAPTEAPAALRTLSTRLHPHGQPRMKASSAS